MPEMQTAPSEGAADTTNHWGESSTGTVALPGQASQTELHAALWYARHGWPVGPIHSITETHKCTCGNPRCGNNAGKHPRTPRGYLDFTVDAATICDFWRRWPGANVGINLEAAGLVVIGPDNPDRLAEFKRYGLPDGAAVAESGGGPGHVHFVYRAPLNCPPARRCVPEEFDILAGGLAVVPPSLHRSGYRRRWLAPFRPDELPEAPTWAVEMLREAEARKRPVSPYAIDTDAVTSEPPPGLSPLGLSYWRGIVSNTKRDSMQIDRSRTLFWLGRHLALTGLPAEGIACLVAQRDMALGYFKYAGRPDAAVRYAEIADSAVEWAGGEPFGGGGHG